MLGGDLRQVTTVRERRTHAQIVEASLKRLSAWRHFRQMNLTVNMWVRTMAGQAAHEQQRWVDFLMRIGDGREPIVRGDDVIEVPQNLIGSKSHCH